MSSRTDFDSDALVSARKIVADLSADVRRGRILVSDPPEWGRLRWLAFRHFALIMPGRALRAGWRALAGALQRRRLSQRPAQIVIEVRPRQ